MTETTLTGTTNHSSFLLFDILLSFHSLLFRFTLLVDLCPDVRSGAKYRVLSTNRVTPGGGNHEQKNFTMCNAANEGFSGEHRLILTCLLMTVSYRLPIWTSLPSRLSPEIVYGLLY